MLGGGGGTKPKYYLNAPAPRCRTNDYCRSAPTGPPTKECTPSDLPLGAKRDSSQDASADRTPMGNGLFCRAPYKATQRGVDHRRGLNARQGGGCLSGSLGRPSKLQRRSMLHPGSCRSRAVGRWDGESFNGHSRAWWGALLKLSPMEARRSGPKLTLTRTDSVSVMRGHPIMV